MSAGFGLGFGRGGAIVRDDGAVVDGAARTTGSVIVGGFGSGLDAAVGKMVLDVLAVNVGVSTN